MSQIRVVIGRDGKATVEAVDAKGSSCTDLTRFIEEGLGKAGGRTLKPEYHEDQGAGLSVGQGA